MAQLEYDFSDKRILYGFQHFKNLLVDWIFVKQGHGGNEILDSQIEKLRQSAECCSQPGAWARTGPAQSVSHAVCIVCWVRRKRCVGV